MAPYRPGVLIHNFNEDQFGEDLVISRRHDVPDPTPQSVSRSTFRHPKELAAEATGAAQRNLSTSTDTVPQATVALEGHLLFGHSGQMENTVGMKCKSYVSASNYFYQTPAFCVDPLKPDRSRIVPEEYYKTKPPTLNETNSSLTQTKAKEWRSPLQPFLSVSRKELAKESPTTGLETQRKARINGEFTRMVDMVKTLR